MENLTNTPNINEQPSQEGENCNLDQVLVHLRTNDPDHRHTAIQYALNHPSEITPYLLEILQNALSNPNDFIPPICDGEHSFVNPCAMEIWERKHNALE